jgi:hypothetical protein
VSYYYYYPAREIKPTEEEARAGGPGKWTLREREREREGGTPEY